MHHGLRAIQATYGGHNPISNAMLGAACRPLSSVVVRAHRGDSVELR